jgi:hypothetical protein
MAVCRERYAEGFSSTCYTCHTNISGVQYETAVQFTRDHVCYRKENAKKKTVHKSNVKSGRYGTQVR